MNPVVDRAISTARSRGRRRRDELDQLEVAQRRLLHQGPRLLDRQVGDDQAVQPGGRRVVEVAIGADPVDDRVRDHRDHRRVVEPRRALGAEGPQGLEDVPDLHPALERPVIAGGDHRAVGDRVGIGDPHLDQVRAPGHQLADQHRRRRQVGVAGRHERHQGAALLVAEAGEQGVDSVHGNVGQVRAVRMKVLGRRSSLGPRGDCVRSARRGAGRSRRRPCRRGRRGRRRRPCRARAVGLP